MDKIKSLLEGFSLDNIIPPLDTLLGKVEALVRIAIILGPVIMLVLGLLYWFRGPKEANRHFGFRTYFGMGSVEAWRFTQKLAGLLWTGLGGLLFIIMGIISLTLRGKDAFTMMNTAKNCLIWQLVLIGLCCLGITIAAAVFFDKDGNPRKR